MRHYLALGDSYTCGEAVAPEQAFPWQLAARLRQEGVQVADPTIIAVTGWTTQELRAGIAAKGPRGPFDIVTLLIGVNNQYRGTEKGYTPEGYQKEFAGLLQTAIGLAGNRPGHVIVMSIPDWGVMPAGEGSDRAGIAAEINRYNAANEAETRRLGALYADVTEISRQAADDTSLVASDGLHPSRAMYALWVERLLPLVPRQ